MRVKLITAILTLVAIALLTISVAGLGFLRSYQLGQADSQLTGLASASGPGSVSGIVQSYLAHGRSQPYSSPSAAIG